MAAWPSNLPGPQRTISVRPGSNLTRQTWQSGRAEVRRFGAGAPDQVTVQFRLFNEDCAAFQYFCDRTANHGVNWFSAPWLAAMGYPSHRARILGYPKRKGRGVRYSDYSVTLLIQDAAYCPEDTAWPSAGPGTGGGGETPVEGLVVAWGRDATNINSQVRYAPADLYAVKVQILLGGTIGLALLADGTVRLWGKASDLAYFSGWEGLGSIKDITGSSSTYFAYVTTTGTVGMFGSSYPSVPTITNAVSIHSCGQNFIAVLDDGSLVHWGVIAAVPDPPTALSNPKYIVGGPRSNEFAAIDQSGQLYVWGAYDDHGALSGAPTVTDASCAAISSYSGMVWHEDGSWEDWGDRKPGNPPAGLQPTFAETFYLGAGAIHQDGTVVQWGGRSAAAYIPVGLKAHQASFYGGGSGSSYQWNHQGLAIQMED